MHEEKEKYCGVNRGEGEEESHCCTAKNVPSNSTLLYRYSVRKSKTQLVYYLLIVLLIKRHVSA